MNKLTNEGDDDFEFTKEEFESEKEITYDDVLEYIDNMPEYQLRDFLCDILRVQHTVSKEKILMCAAEKFKL